VALIAGGSLRVNGSGQSRSKLVGLLVSRGDLSLSGVTVVGAVICAGDAGRTLTMENVNVFGSPKGLQFEFAMGWGGVATSYKVEPDPTIGEGGLVRLKQVDDASAPGGKRDAVPADFVGRFDASTPGAPLLLPTDFEVVPVNGGNPTTLEAAGISMQTGPAYDGLFRALQEKTQTEAAPQPQGAFSQGQLSLDLNKFLRVGDTLQVVHRRIH
jgi:hypothetical protein